MFEQAFTQEFETISALENRIYPLTSPEANADSGVPYLIYGSSEGLRDKSLGEGYLDSKTVEVELNIVAARYADMKTITKQVVDLLLSFELRKIGTTGPFIQELVYEAPVEIYEEEPDLYRCVVEFTAYFKEES